MRRRWSGEEIAALKRMAASGLSISEMAEQAGRSETAVRGFLKKRRIHRKGANTHWTQKEEAAFRDDWLDGELSMVRLTKKYGRSVTALRQRAVKLGLGRRPASDFFLTRGELKAALGVSDSKLSSWIRQGLPVHKSRSNRTYGAMFDLEEALLFLEERQSDFDGSRLDESYFYELPHWLLEKRREDCVKQNWHYRSRWSSEEDSRLKHLFSCGRTDRELAEALGRTEPAVKARRFQMGLRRQRKEKGSVEIQKD